MSSLWIINKAGGLVYQADHFPGAKSLTSNEALILAGTLHGIHAITARIDPTPGAPKRGADAGLETLDAGNFRLSVLMTATGTKFVLISTPWHPNPQVTLQRAYDAYVDQVMKNPFHTAEMPIRVQGFDQAIEKLVKA